MSTGALGWKVLSEEGEARAGVLETRRGRVETPVFMPVGTLGTVKGTRFEELESKELDARIILGNTYHLWLRPGVETVRACGGLHRFVGWRRAMLTDSGGFQVWSLGDIRKIREEGVEFRSHVDGAQCFLSPEVSMEVQAALGAEVVMAFDECAPGEATHDEAERSMELTARWARRSRARFDTLQREGADAGRVETDGASESGDARESSVERVSNDAHELNGERELSGGRGLSGRRELSGAQSLFGIVQGATFLDLRRESLARTVEVGFDGYAIGGLSVGEEKPVMYEVVEEIAPLMPRERPRYLMGVGTPEDLLECVARGVDMFDCVLPTRNGRTGQAYTSRGRLNIKNARFSRDARPLDDECACSVCRRHSRAYLRHLHMTGEMLAAILLTHHNLAFFLDTMRRVRQAIRSGEFTRFRREFTERLSFGVE
ncbi:MAG TPA: tRNA guanosine(34) transglycosylase Tgt [Pyrinomonadaceae bacterium]|nr:tRNA guanosine(34) transglycosylase Tgt [Pyrinomonadaceae bacterium]